MRGFERFAVLWAMIYMIVYFPFFLLFGFLVEAHKRWGSVSDDTL